jgi:hypothetical protein
MKNGWLLVSRSVVVDCGKWKEKVVEVANITTLRRDKLLPSCLTPSLSLSLYFVEEAYAII